MAIIVCRKDSGTTKIIIRMVVAKKILGGYIIGSIPRNSAPVNRASLSRIECRVCNKKSIAIDVSSANSEAVRRFGERSIPHAIKPKRVTGRVLKPRSIPVLTVIRFVRIAVTKSSMPEAICCQSCGIKGDTAVSAAKGL